MRISLRRLALVFVLSLFASATCVDFPTGPRAGSGRATFGITPVFSGSATHARAVYAAAGLELDHVRLVITRPPTEVVKDTTVVYNGSGDLPIELAIIGPVGERLTVRLDYISGANVLYSGTTTVTTVSPLTPANEVPQSTIVIDPVGPGFNAASVVVTPSSGSFPTNAPVNFTAKAFTAANAEIAGALFVWSVNDETVGTVSSSGTLTPASKGGPIKVRATTLNETFGEVTVTLTPPAPPTPVRTWTGATSTSWTTASNWNPAGVPVAGDSVIIPGSAPFAPSITANTTVRAIVVQSTATLNVGAFQVLTTPGKITNDGSLNLTSSIIGGALDNLTGTVIIQGNSAIAGAIANGASATLRIQGVTGIGAGALVAASTITNDGTIDLTDGNGNSALLQSAGVLTNTASGVISVSQGGAGSRVLSAPLVNQGVITIASGAGLGMALASMTATNSGTIDVTSGNLTVTQTGTSPSFTNTGTIAIGANRVVSIIGGAASFTSGAVTGSTGILSLSGVTVDLTPSGVSVPLTTDAATTVLGGTLTIPGGQELTLISSTFSSAINLQGTLTARRATTLLGTFANTAGSVLRSLGTGGFPGDLTIAAGFTNNGVIQLTDSAASNGARLTVSIGALVNAPSAQIQPLAGAGGTRTLTADLNNQGSLTIGDAQGLTIDGPNAAHTNSGSINLTTGNLTVTQSGSPATFTNAGTISVPSGRTLTINGGSAALGDGLVTGVGTVTLNGVATTFTPRSSFPFLTTNAATTLNGGAVTVGAGDELNLLNATVSSNITLNGMLSARRTTTITGTFANASGSVLRAFGTGGFPGSLTIAAGFTNNGTIQLTDSASSNGASLTVTSGTLVNTASAQIQPLAGAGGTRTLTAALNNQGSLTIGDAQGLTIDAPNAAHANSGSINLTTGNLTITQSGTPATFTNTGTISVPAGRTLTISGGSAALGDGLVTGVGTVTLNGVAMTFTPRTTFPFLTTNAATSLNGGSLTVAAGEELNLLAATVSSNITLNGTLTARRTTSITGTFTNGAGSLLRAFGTGGFPGSLTIAASFTNNGVIQLTDSAASNGASLTVSTGTLVNTASAQIQPLAGAGGTRTLTAALNNQGALTIGDAQGLTINGPNAANTNIGSISLTTGDLTITQSGAPATFTNTGTISVPTGRTLTINGGSATLGDGLVTGLGTVVLNGVATTFTARTSFPFLTTNAATSLNGGTLTIGTNDQLTLVSATVSSNVTVNGTLTARRTTSITGAFSNSGGSTLRAFGTGGFPGNLTISAGFTNNGTIQLTDSAASNGASLTISTGTLVNAAAGQIQPLAGAGGTRTLTAALNNQGTFSIGDAQGLTINGPNAAHTNSGSITLTTGDLTITQSGAPATFTNSGSGTISIPNGRTLFINGGTAALGINQVFGPGTLNLNGVAVSFDPRSNFPVITSNATTAFNAGTLTIPDTVELTFVASTISSNVALAGKLTARRTTSITGAFSNTTLSVLRALGAGGFPGSLTIANGFTNNGMIQLTDSAASNGASLAVTTGTLVNAASGQIQPLAGAGGTRTLAAALNNLGTLTIGDAQGLTINKSGAVHTNSGIINVSTGDLTLTQAAGGTFTNSGSGSISIPINRTLFISGGTASLGINKVAGSGTLNLSGVAVSFDPRTNFPVITSDATTSFNGGTLTIPDTVELTFVASTIASNVSLAGMLTARRTTSITGTFSSTAGSVLRAMGTGGFPGALTIANGFINNGSIQLTDSLASNGASLTVTSGTLTNAVGGTINPLPGSGGTRTLTATTLLNQGTFTINNSQGITIAAQLNNTGTFTVPASNTTPVVISKAGAAHTNSGTISIPAITIGTVTIGATGVTQTFSNTGTITIGSGRTLQLAGNTAFTNAAGGTYAPTFGTLNVAATSSFTNNGTIAPGGAGVASQMNYTGVWNPGTGGTINIELSSGARDVIAITGAATFGGTLNVSALAGYTPSGTQNHNIMTFTSQTGSFGTINKPGVCLNPIVVSGTILQIGC